MRIEIDTEKEEIRFIGITTLSDLVSCIENITLNVDSQGYRVFVFPPNENIEAVYPAHSVNAILVGTEFNPNFYEEPTTC